MSISHRLIERAAVRHPPCPERTGSIIVTCRGTLRRRWFITTLIIVISRFHHRLYHQLSGSAKEETTNLTTRIQFKVNNQSTGKPVNSIRSSQGSKRQSPSAISQNHPHLPRYLPRTISSRHGTRNRKMKPAIAKLLCSSSFKWAKP